MTYRYLVGICWLFGATLMWAAEPTAIDPKGVEFFEKNIRPILTKHCYECHGPEDVNGGLRLDSRTGWMAGGDSGDAITPGDPDNSLVIEAVRYENRDLQMPPKNKLAAGEIAALEQWVKLGAPDPREAAAVANTGPTGMSIEDGRQFWSFRPVVDPPPPTVQNPSWISNPLDAFLLAALEQQGLAPAPPADRRTLIRRATLDLTGLPPTAAEVEAFVADDSPDAYPRLIERLLASPHYGERWGRHWLDVGRYADSNGLDENLAYGHAWRYRDYVVRSFNDDKPYDQFVIEQLAGDLVPHANRETITGTAFLVLGAKVLAEPDREKLVMDTIDEQLDCLGKAFLGMTFGCVRCHDHKFDPIKQTDYYAMAAILKGTRTFADSQTGVIKHWNEHSYTTEEEQAAIKTVEAEIAKKNGAASSYKNQAMAKIRGDAKAKAVDYLVTAAKFSPDMPLTLVSELAEPKGLHPRILHHCRLHLEYHRDDPLFAPWHEMAAREDLAGIETHYRTLFDEADAALAEAKKKDPKATKVEDARLESARLALNDSSGFLAVPPKPEFAFDESTLAEYNRLMEIARVTESNAPDATAVMGVGEATVHRDLPIHIRGSHRNLGEAVAREVPQVMRSSEVRPVWPAHQSGRLELAQWIGSTRHPLTARVMANRIWGWHFGAGLVRSTENFGRLGDRPTHPELLDFLARRFMESGWSVKELHRLIMLSSAYQMASTHSSSDAEQAADPENRLLWKFPLQRMEAEQIRDSLLAVSGRLDVSMGGKTIPLRNRQFVFNHTSVDHTKYDSLRRALYLPVVRNNLYTLFEQFDFPDPTMPTGHRHSTVVAPQALLMMNAGIVMDSAQELAERAAAEETDSAKRVDWLYRQTFGRPATKAESDRALAFIEKLSPSNADADEVSALRPWSLLCQSLFASNEFIYIR